MLSHRDYLRSIVLIWLFLLPVQRNAFADEPIVLAGEAEYAAAEAGETCSVLRAVIRNTQDDFKQAAEARGGSRKVLQERQTELQACAREHHLSFSRDAGAQALLAEVCRDAFGAWLESGTTYRMLNEDTGDTQSSLHLLMAHARTRCRSLPET